MRIRLCASLMIFCALLCAFPSWVFAATTTYFPSQNYNETNGVGTVNVFLGNTLIATVQGSGASSTVQYVHTDALQSARVVTNQAGKPTEFLGYTPYGATLLDKQTSGVKESRTFIGQYADPSTALSYLNARYYDSKRGQFLSEDPVFWADPLSQNLMHPQGLNSYSYANDNPVTSEDPTGLLTLIIPGTFYNPSDWKKGGIESSFVKAVGKSFNDSAHTKVIDDRSVWSGADTSAARESAAEKIADFINSYSFAKNEPLNLVGHSHGGNVAIRVTDLVSHPVNNLVTLSTPVRSDYVPNAAVVQNHINVYSARDPVQNLMGGTGTSASALIGGLILGQFGFLLGSVLNYDEMGMAGRTYANAHNVDTTAGSGWFVGAHSNAITNLSAWKKASAFIQ